MAKGGSAALTKGLSILSRTAGNSTQSVVNRYMSITKNYSGARSLSGATHKTSSMTTLASKVAKVKETVRRELCVAAVYVKAVTKVSWEIEKEQHEVLYNFLRTGLMVNKYDWLKSAYLKWGIGLAVSLYGAKMAAEGAAGSIVSGMSGGGAVIAISSIAEDVFRSADKIIFDESENEFYYIRGNDLLRIMEILLVYILEQRAHVFWMQ